jgi:hypothetical protein
MAEGVTDARDRAGQLPPDIREAIAAIRRWGEQRGWRGFDPYDGLNSPFAPALSLGTPLGRRLVTQAVKLSPVNLRPLLRIAPALNAKAIALVASAYARIWAADGDERARAEAERWLGWLVENGSPSEGGGLGWGYHFDVQTRFFFYARGTPNTIATSFVAQALLDGCALLNDGRWREPAVRAVNFLESRMLVDEGRRRFFRYVPDDTTLIHNANLLACAVLARAAAVADAVVDRELVARAVEASLAAQRADGSWPYADAPGQGWVDNFHTGYVLESLATCLWLVPDALLQLEPGIDYWHERLFDADGRPRYTPSRARPLDAHCYAQAIDTWLAVAPWRPEAHARADRLARLLVSDLLAPSGFVYFRRGRRWPHPVPFVRWSTAPAFRALSGLARFQA